LAVLTFGLALAQPFILGSADRSANVTQELVLLVDNSLSMSYVSDIASRLDDAKSLCRELIDELAAGSRVRVIPLCGTPDHGLRYQFALFPRQSLRALNEITCVDRSLTFDLVVDAIRRVQATRSPLPRRFLLVSDHQDSLWRNADELLGRLQSESIEMVDVHTGSFQNAWIDNVRLERGIAEVGVPATVSVRVRCETPSRQELQLRLVANGETVVSRSLLFDHRTKDHELRIVLTPASDPSGWTRLSAIISPDRLTADNERHLVVPLVERLPILFIDQWGTDENLTADRIGETWPLRKLVGAARQHAGPRVRQWQHHSIADIDRGLLSRSRLVVIAGVRDPSTVVQMLREFVEQGGQLMIVAGGEFDVQAWTTSAWSDGYGILPLPLLPTVLDARTADGEVVQPFFLDRTTVGGVTWFQLPGVTAAETEALSIEPVFLRSVRVDESAKRAAVAADNELRRRWDAVATSSAALPSWLAWQSTTTGEAAVHPNTRNAGLRLGPRFTDADATPYLVERAIGRGRVILVSSGLAGDWNTLSRTNAIVFFDHMIRELLKTTFPSRNLTAVGQLNLPLNGLALGSDIVATRVGEEGLAETLQVSFMRANLRGVVLEGLWRRGLIKLAAKASQAQTDTETRTMWLSVNGPAEESNWRPFPMARREALATRFNLQMASTDTASGILTGKVFWKWLIAVVLLMFLVESVLLWEVSGTAKR
jgi:hypothetical protein